MAAGSLGDGYRRGGHPTGGFPAPGRGYVTDWGTSEHPMAGWHTNPVA